MNVLVQGLTDLIPSGLTRAMITCREGFLTPNLQAARMQSNRQPGEYVFYTSSESSSGSKEQNMRILFEMGYKAWKSTIRRMQTVSREAEKSEKHSRGTCFFRSPFTALTYLQICDL